MAGRRRVSALIVLLAGTMLFESGSAAGPNLPPAPYKPLPVGTVLDYGSWKCEILNSVGFETVCGWAYDVVSTYGLFFAIYDKNVDQIMGSVAEGGGADYMSGTQFIYPVSIDDKARTAIKNLWPLKIGNRAAFKFSSGWVNSQSTLSVDRTETVQIVGKSRSTFVVTQDVTVFGDGFRRTTGCDPTYRRTIWYDPSSGIVVRDRMRWLDGVYQGIGWDSELVEAQFPKLPMVAQAAPVTSLSRSGTRVAAKHPRSQPKPETGPGPFADVHFGEYRALVIGNNVYRDLPGLKTAANDARVIAAELRADYGFEVDLLVDATRSDIFEALAKLRSQLTANDNLLIYYAGHGYLDEIAQVGYWLPVDAGRDVQTNWVSNGDVTAMLRAIRAKHIMVVADSCYAGTLVRSAGVRLKTTEARAAWIERMAAKRSRTALVSGGLEPVADSGGGIRCSRGHS